MSTTINTNIFAPPTTTGGQAVPGSSGFCFYSVTHMRVVNPTAAAIQVNLGITGAGTNTAPQSMWGNTSVPAQGQVDWYSSGARVDAANGDSINGNGGGAGLIVDGEAEMGVT